MSYCSSGGCAHAVRRAELQLRSVFTMTYRSCLVGALVAIALVPSMAPAQGGRRGDPEPGRYGWLATLEAGKAEARRTGKPIMVALRCVP
jgi:hypothetical protein